MNDRMYRDAATQANLATLRERGITVIEPEEGALASRGEHGVGRLPEPRALLDAIEAVPRPGRAALGRPARAGLRRRHPRADRPGSLHRQPLRGRMGLALAERAARRGAEVTLVAANVVAARAARRAAGRRRDRRRAGRRARAASSTPADVLVMAAAPADFRPKRAAGEKIHREGTGGFELDLEATEDILASLSARRREGQTIVGFAAETDCGPVERAREKLERKGADAIVLNDVSAPRSASRAPTTRS